MDPTKVIDQITAPWAGTLIGSVVIALGAGLVILAIMLYRSWQAHLAEVKSCGEKNADMLTKNIEAQNRTADALDGNSQVMKAALEALKK